METSRLLASDSFSYSWLSTGNSTPKPNQIHEEDQDQDFMFNINVDYHGSLSLEIDQYPSFSTRRTIRIHDYDHEAENFNFDVGATISDNPSMSSIASTTSSVFSNGFIVPAATDNDSTSSTDTTATDTTATTTTAHDHPHQNWSSSSSFSSVSSPSSIMVPNCFRKLGKSSRKVLRKCLSGIFSSCKKGSAGFIASRRSIRVDDLNRRVLQEVNQSWRSAAAKPIIPSSSSSSPRISTTYSVSADWSDSESSVYEAIMYCKRSSTGH